MINNQSVLIPYNEKWRMAYLKEYKTLESVLGSYVLDIQHIGSTAIPGLEAKPVIDIAIGVRTLKDVKFFKNHLVKVGYTFSEEPNDKIIFLKKDDEKSHCLHVHVYNSHGWCSQIKFRDKLRKDEALKAAYLATKRELAKLYGEDDTMYTRLKSEFIEKLLT